MESTEEEEERERRREKKRERKGGQFRKEGKVRILMRMTLECFQSAMLLRLLLLVMLVLSQTRVGAGEEDGEGLTPRLAKWLSQRETPSKLSSKIVQDRFPGMGSGFKAREKVYANDTLIQVPMSVFMSLKTATDSKLKPVVIDLFQNNCSANAILALHVLHERSLGEASNFSAYIESLPKAFDLPVVWTDEELAELNGTQLLPKVVQQRGAIEKEYQDVILPVLQSLQYAELLKDFRYGLSEYFWAYCCVVSRAFLVQVEDSRLPLLIPGIDLFNSGPVETHLNIDQEKGVVSVVTSQEYSEGEQVFLNLGNEPNLGLMLTQGFALANNPDDFVELYATFDLKDPFMDTKRKILRYLNVTENPVFLMRRKGQIPKDLITSLRVHTMKPSEFDNFKELEKDKPLSLQNELDVSRELLLACQKSLQAFPTSVKEDDELLHHPGGLPRRKAYAVLYRRSEKLVYIEAMHAISESWNSILFSGDAYIH